LQPAHIRHEGRKIRVVRGVEVEEHLGAAQVARHRVSSSGERVITL
jgi:hypothetical protein